MIDLAVIPVAGRGTTLLPLTKSQPKEMLPVGRKPVVQYVVEELIHNGVNNLLFVTGSGKTAIENHFDTNEELIRYLRLSGKEDMLTELAFERREARYFYVRQRHLLGLGHAILHAEPFVKGRRFVVALGDTIIGLHHKAETIRRMVRIFEQEADSVKAVIAFDQVDEADVVHYGIAAVKKTAGEYFELDDLIEKPAEKQAP
ncbi:MAG: sugar phosphate nucleotidyltransferase, partial [Planctomycetaceae bacterium]|nr:sugar phosphate nucleotidyltransferase [Planctomycetaceae bacterium]